MGNLKRPTNSAQLRGLATNNVAGRAAQAAPLKPTLITTALTEAVWTIIFAL